MFLSKFLDVYFEVVPQKRLREMAKITHFHFFSQKDFMSLSGHLQVTSHIINI